MDGKRTLAKFYDSKLNNKQFERRLFAKTKTAKTKDDIIILDGVLIVHKFIVDSHIYVVGEKNENPLILDSVLSCIVEVVGSRQSDNIGGNSVIDSITRVIQALDQIVDEGQILEVDPNLVLERIPSAEEGLESMASRTARILFRI